MKKIYLRLVIRWNQYQARKRTLKEMAEHIDNEIYNTLKAGSHEYVIDAEHYENRIRHDFAMANMECSENIIITFINLIATAKAELNIDIYGDLLRAVLPPMKIDLDSFL